MQLQASSFIRWGDIEGQSKKRHRNRIEIMPNVLPQYLQHIVRVYALLYEGYHRCEWGADCVLTYPALFLDRARVPLARSFAVGHALFQATVPGVAHPFAIAERQVT